MRYVARNVKRGRQVVVSSAALVQLRKGVDALAYHVQASATGRDHGSDESAQFDDLPAQPVEVQSESAANCL